MIETNKPPSPQRGQRDNSANSVYVHDARAFRLAILFSHAGARTRVCQSLKGWHVFFFQSFVEKAKALLATVSHADDFTKRRAAVQ